MRRKGPWRRAAGAWIVLPLVLWAGTGSPRPVSALAQQSRVAPAHATISAGLVAEVAALPGHRRGAFAGHEAHSLRLEVEARADVSRAIVRLGGTVTADIRGHVLAARLPAMGVEGSPPTQPLPGCLPLSCSPRHLTAASLRSEHRRVWSMPDATGLPIRGNHVIIGIVDSGIDLTNQDFLNPDGSTVWGPSASGIKQAPGRRLPASTLEHGAIALDQRRRLFREGYRRPRHPRGRYRRRQW